MNSVAPSLPAVNTDLYPYGGEFVVAIFDTDISPYMLGRLDAECGEFCLPELYFVRKGEQREYVEGYESVTGRTNLSGQILCRKAAMTNAEIAEELADYTADIAGREYHVHGQW